ncbi:hypothetical protein SNE35_31705 [Paucibacter sp. R3-3]|uniref:Protein kinase domain-containing protein n=1 Tax=Roseateles agri TaxID=3098619 RepID=A0ABU5DS11_9BURK|nr:hypothetical protein [Paucibacter sp. R3-3]MDY0749105.1 hypothetical protein [Paucibacter sp. R3-3]
MDQRGKPAERVLVDGTVLLTDPDVMRRIHKRPGLVIVTSAVLAQIDGIAKRGGALQASAQALTQQLRSAPAVRLQSFPAGGLLQGQDVLVRRSCGDVPIHVLERPMFRSPPGGGADLIEVARDYDMVLLTRDDQLWKSARAAGAQAVMWTGPPRTSAQGAPAVPPGPRLATAAAVKPFAVCREPIREVETQVKVSQLPVAGDVVRFASGTAVALGRQISAGGEGIIYEVLGGTQVCKVYHREKLTHLKQRKIELMVSRRIERPGVCWPTHTVSNAAGEFVGYVMPRATGQTMQSTVCVPPRLSKVFPDWTRLDLVNVAGTFIDHVEFLHRHNVLIGDINPMNLLVTADSTAVWMVDTDSFQIESFPCPVGTVNFTAPEIQGRNYPEFLRTLDHELFAVATMIFMILFPGKAPYSQQGGGSPGENIKSRNFPYRYFTQGGSTAADVSGEDAPQGSWQYIWAHLPNPLRQAFYATFRENRRTSVGQWTDLLLNYRDRLQRQSISNEMFPLHFPIHDPVEVPCGKCEQPFTNSKRYVDKLSAAGKSPWCPDCQHRMRLVRLARDSHKAAQEAVGAPAPRAKPASTAPAWRSTAPQPVPHRPAALPPPSPPTRSGSYRPAPTPGPTFIDVVGRLLSQLFK